MGVQKAHLKKAFLFDQGKKQEDMIEAVIRDQHRAEGAASSLQQAAKHIQQLATLVDDDMRKERYGIEEGSRIKEYITRAVQLVADMTSAQDKQRLIAMGRAEGVRAVVKFTKNEFDEADRRLKELQEIAALGESEDPKTRVVGQAPAMPDFMIRDEADEGEEPAEASDGDEPDGSSKAEGAEA